jgi:molybdopterin-guanine dinucleotide biosynthesis protein A
VPSSRQSKVAVERRGTVAISILAGGLSSRMGREKSRLRLGRRSLLGHIRRTANSLGLPVRVIRRDRIAQRGPLGGIYTALKTSRADAELFLACDMPFVSAALLERLIHEFRLRPGQVFAASDEGVGFPFLLEVGALPLVERQMQAGRFSLQALAATFRARRLRVPRVLGRDLFNVNTPADWETARAMFREREFSAQRKPTARVFSRLRRAGENPGRRPL